VLKIEKLYFVKTAATQKNTQSKSKQKTKQRHNANAQQKRNLGKLSERSTIVKKTEKKTKKNN